MSHVCIELRSCRVWLTALVVFLSICARAHVFESDQGRERISLNSNWQFLRTEDNLDGVSYDRRNDTPPNAILLKPWILPSANDFIRNPLHRHGQPLSDPNTDIPYTKKSYNDSDWESLTLPHDWAINGPFYTGLDAKIGGPMGRLPVHGVGWYRRKINKLQSDEGKSIYLDIEGAQSYAMIWVNEKLVGGWPFGYNSFRLDLTPFLTTGADNILAIRLDNPVASSRFYPGGGIYRNMWLTKVSPIQVGQYGTHIRSRNISVTSAILDLTVSIANKGPKSRTVDVVTTVHVLDASEKRALEQVAAFPSERVTIKSGQKVDVDSSVKLNNPQLWGPTPAHTPNLYVAITRVSQRQQVFDTYETTFGVRSLVFDANHGLLVNGQRVQIQGVNQHHDLGALGAAFNVRAAERQLETLHELGCNAIRMSHNPPATQLLELTDRLGFLVVDEIFDMWERNKTRNDFHLIFEDWHEPDLRSFIRRDRNHPSVISWSYGNEVREQDSAIGGRGIEVSQRLLDIVHEEDSTRPASFAQCCVGPDSPFSGVPDIINLNYRGEGIGDTPPYANNRTKASTTHPEYPDFHALFPEKLIFGSEYAASLSTRGEYMFPVTNETSVPVSDLNGGNSTSRYISSYDLYTTDAGSAPDRVFAIQDQNPYVAGGFVWSGWDYIGEPHPYLLSRSSSFGIIDLAGFKKDRFFLYQARWRPEYPMAHILPHWTWPERAGKVTPVHVHSAADEAELFLNGRSQGRLKKEPLEYRFRWDEIVYEPGELRVETFKDGVAWAQSSVQTADNAAKVQLTADRRFIKADGLDLVFVTATITDEAGRRAPRASDSISFSVAGSGEIVATDNGNPTDMTVFKSPVRNAFNGLVLAIVRAKPGSPGKLAVTATAQGLDSASITIESK